MASHSLSAGHRLAPKDRLHHLLELFDAAAVKLPAIRKERTAVEKLEKLRTVWLPRTVSEWPLDRVGLGMALRSSLEVVNCLAGDSLADPSSVYARILHHLDD